MNAQFKVSLFTFQYKNDQEVTALRFQQDVKSLASVIEAALFEELKGLPHERIKEMSPSLRQQIIDSALEKVLLL